VGLKVGKEKVVELAFKLLDGDKNVIDSADRSAPMPYIHGMGQLLPAVEEALEGKESNFCTTLNLRADQAYGPRYKELVVELPREHFPQDVELKEGMAFNTLGPNGEPIVVEITKLEAEKVTVDGNHPLAGLDLEYFLEVVSIRDASKDELAHGHVHGPGGHHHDDDEHFH
jgi:FKBP-type peptidyl-prolyl cis-trans isomerase SlyD